MAPPASAVASPVHDIVARAASLRERLAAAHRAAADPLACDPLACDPLACDPLARDARARELVALWRRAAAGDDAAAWANRLAWEDPGLDEETVARALGAPLGAPLDEDAGGPAPEWADLLAEAIAVAERASAAAPPCDPAWPRRERVAFRELLLPFAAVAARRVAEAEGAGAAWAAVARPARDELTGALLERLGAVAQRALAQEFIGFRAGATNGAPPTLAAVLGGDRRRLYRAFVDGHLADGYAELFARYPALARLLATQAAWWVENTAALLRRLVDDWPTLRRELALPDAEPAAALRRVEANLSDPHRGGRSVSILHFASGAAVAYKPRSLGAERCFFALVEWVNGHVALPLRRLAVVDRGEYGWVEYAAVAPCDDAAAVARFYERAGMLLGLAYLLGASDLHSGNVLACGEHPVFVDLEVLFAALVSNGAAADRDSRRAILDSVMYTALLPMRGGHGVDDELLDGGFFPRPRRTFRQMALRHVNTDAMTWGECEIEVDPGHNVPTLGGRAVGPLAHRREMQDGFARVYDVLLRRRDELLAADGPLAPFRSTRVRLVFRGTAAYGAIITRSLSPAFLRGGVHRSAELDALKRPLLRQGARPRLWQIWVEEQRELEGGDYPVFYAEPGSSSLWSGTGVEIRDALLAPGWDAVEARARGLSPEDCVRQRELLRLLLANGARYAAVAERAPSAPSAPSAASAASAPGAAAPADAADWGVEEAERIGEVVAEARMEGRPGTWLTAPVSGDGAQSLREVGPSLFDGRAGIALFFSALARCTGSARAAAHAADAWRETRAALATAAGASALADAVGIGAGTGMGGLVFALTRSAQLLDDASLLRAARAAADTLDDRRVAADATLDLLGGAAGAVLGLLALHDATGDERAVERARRCGARLAAAQLAAPGDLAGHWPGARGVPETGFAHGTAGMVAALARLHAATGDARALDAAAAGLAALGRCRRPAEGGGAGCWHDRADREDVEPDERRWCSWCRGGTGIGFALLTLSASGPAPALAAAAGGGDGLAEGLAAALAASRDAAVPARDHLCCGAAGRIELALAAGVALGRPELVADARARGERLRDAGRRAGYRVGLPADLCPTFFQGLSGIGYAMLRLARPGDVPSVLLWQ